MRNLPEIDLSDIDIDEHALFRYSTRTIKRLGRKKFARFKLKDEVSWEREGHCMTPDLGKFESLPIA